ncbi:MAG: PHP domain-containing protein [Chloroflexota bacterium]
MTPCKYGFADLHIHTRFSDGIAELSEVLEHVQLHTNLDVIAITDHDSFRGAWLARELAAKDDYRFQVVPGMEVSTMEGHLLVLFLENPVSSYESLRHTIEATHAQGGICVVPHPMSRQRDSIDRKTIEGLLASGDENVHLDGLEILDPHAARIMCLEDVEALNRECYHLAELGNSDGHALSVIASRYTVFCGRTIQDLRESIRSRRTRGWTGPFTGFANDL